MANNKIYSVPVYDMPRYDVRKKKVRLVKAVDEFAFSHEDKLLINRVKEIALTINRLKQERKEALTVLKKRELLRNQHRLRPVKLYALRLEDDCWYIGMSYDPLKRFRKHQVGKGAQWTKVHPPVAIYEVRETKEYIQDNAAKFEDDMTLEYALKYGSEYVRGGGYVQARPQWPDVIRQNEYLQP